MQRTGKKAQQMRCWDPTLLIAMIIADETQSPMSNAFLPYLVTRRIIFGAILADRQIIGSQVMRLQHTMQGELQALLISGQY